MNEKLLHEEITDKILFSFFSVNKAIERGIETDFYRNALAVEFKHNNLTFQRNFTVQLEYRGEKIGELFAEFLIEKKVMVKVVDQETIDRKAEQDARQLLKNSEIEICRVLNAAGENDFKRVFLSNEYKKWLKADNGLLQTFQR